MNVILRACRLAGLPSYWTSTLLGLTDISYLRGKSWWLPQYSPSLLDTWHHHLTIIQGKPGRALIYSVSDPSVSPAHMLSLISLYLTTHLGHASTSSVQLVSSFIFRVWLRIGIFFGGGSAFHLLCHWFCFAHLPHESQEFPDFVYWFVLLTAPSTDRVIKFLLNEERNDHGLDIYKLPESEPPSKFIRVTIEARTGKENNKRSSKLF